LIHPCKWVSWCCCALCHITCHCHACCR